MDISKLLQLSTGVWGGKSRSALWATLGIVLGGSPAQAQEFFADGQLRGRGVG